MLTPPVSREQLKARLNSFETTAATISLDEAATAYLEGSEAAAEVDSADQAADVQTGVRETRARRKRNHDQFDLDEPSSSRAQPELPAKRRRSRNVPIATDFMDSSGATNNRSVSPGQQADSGPQMVVGIVSKAASQTAMSGQEEEEDPFNYAEDAVDGDYQPPRPTTPVSAVIRSEEESRDVTPLSNETSLPLSERILRLNKVIEPDYRMREKDIERGRKRASNGLLLTKDGKIDRRSLRFLGDQENQLPSRWSMAPETPRPGAHNIASQQLSDHFEPPALPSIEQPEFVLDSRSTPQPQLGSLGSSIKLRDQKPFKCGFCKKQYTSRPGLSYHQEHAKNPGCREGEGNVSPKEFTCDMCSGKFVDLQRLDKVRACSSPFGGP